MSKFNIGLLLKLHAKFIQGSVAMILTNIFLCFNIISHGGLLFFLDKYIFLHLFFLLFGMMHLHEFACTYGQIISEFGFLSLLNGFVVICSRWPFFHDSSKAFSFFAHILIQLR